MALTAQHVISIAEAEIGYREKATNAKLDDSTANAGNSNYTKYARDLASAGYYQASKMGYDWCDVFVDWVFFQAAGKDKAKAEAAECQTGLAGAGCTYSRDYYKAKGRLSSTPLVGDQAFFSSSQQDDPYNADHTGIVVAVSGNAVTVIEGNKSNMVCKSTYHIGDGWLYDFGHPLYDGADKIDIKQEPAKEPDKVYSAESYTVQRGDTLWGIAQRFGLSWQKIAEINNLADPGMIYPGQLLVLTNQVTVSAASNNLKIGDRVIMDPEATVYGGEDRYDDFIYKSVLYVRQISDDRIVVSTLQTGAITGAVNAKYLRKI